MAEGSEWQKALDFALNYLSYRDRSRQEVYRRLKEKGFGEGIIENVLAYLIERQYLDDRKFAYRLADYLINRKIVGKIFLRHQLRLKGISDDIIKEVVETAFAEEDHEKELAFELLQKKLNRSPKVDHSKPKGEKKWRRGLISLLLSHGFSHSIIAEIWPKVMNTLGEHDSNPDEIDE